MPKNNSKQNREARRASALKRKEKSDAMDSTQRYATLKDRPGSSQREMDRLGRQIVQQKPKRSTHKATTTK